MTVPPKQIFLVDNARAEALADELMSSKENQNQLDFVKRYLYKQKSVFALISNTQQNTMSAELRACLVSQCKGGITPQIFVPCSKVFQENNIDLELKQLSFPLSVAEKYQTMINSCSYQKKLRFELLVTLQGQIEQVRRELGAMVADCAMDAQDGIVFLVVRPGVSPAGIRQVLQNKCSVKAISKTITKSLVPYSVFKSLAVQLEKPAVVVSSLAVPTLQEESIIITIDSSPMTEPEKKPYVPQEDLFTIQEAPLAKQQAARTQKKKVGLKASTIMLCSQDDSSSSETTEEEVSLSEGGNDVESFYPRAFFSANVQSINVKDLYDALEALEQIQCHRNLIKQHEIKKMLFIGLPQALSATEEKALHQGFHIQMLHNSDTPIAQQAIMAEVAHYASEFLFDAADGKTSRQMRDCPHWSTLPLHAKLNVVLRTDASYDRVCDAINQCFSHYSITSVQNVYGVSTTEKRSRGYFAELAKQLEAKELCTWPISKQFLPFQRYQKLCVQNIEHHYAKSDYIHQLTEQELTEFIQLQTKASLRTLGYCRDLNIIFIDFEFYLATSRYLLPLEVGVARFQDGQLLATYHTFLEPKQFILQALSAKQKALLARGHVQPHTPQTKDLLGAIEEDVFQREFLEFCTWSASALRNSPAFAERRTSITLSPTHQQFKARKISFIVANGLQAEKLALMQEGQQLLAENLIEFEDAIQSLLKRQHFAIQKDDLHGPKAREQHRCRAHVLSEHHCALNDVINLVSIFAEELRASTK